MIAASMGSILAFALYNVVSKSKDKGGASLQKASRSSAQEHQKLVGDGSELQEAVLASEEDRAAPVVATAVRVSSRN